MLNLSNPLHGLSWETVECLEMFEMYRIFKKHIPEVLVIRGQLGGVPLLQMRRLAVVGMCLIITPKVMAYLLAHCLGNWGGLSGQLPLQGGLP